MFSGDLLSQPWFGGAVIAILALLVAGWALSHFDPFDADERITKPAGHDALDSMAEWGINASSQALRRFHEAENAKARERFDSHWRRDANAVPSQCERNANASIGIQAAITARAARDDRVLGFHILDEDGDVDTIPPLTADQEAMLRKIDAVELRVMMSPRWCEWEARYVADAARSIPAFPIALIGRGVSIPPAHCGEVLA